MERYLLVTFLLTFTFECIAASADTEKKFKEDALMYHNHYRQRHEAPPLKLNQTLSGMAAKWAGKVAENDVIKSSFISKETDIEENLCMECGFDFDGRNVTLEWYRQVCNYDFRNHQSLYDIGEIKNFQRMVWKNATEFGIGKAKSKHLPHCSYIVAWYNPIKGSAKDNVFQGRFSGQECPKPGKNQGRRRHLGDRGQRIFLCGGSAEILRQKACEHFGCKNGRFLRHKSAK